MNLPRVYLCPHQSSCLTSFAVHVNRRRGYELHKRYWLFLVCGCLRSGNRTVTPFMLLDGASLWGTGVAAEKAAKKGRAWHPAHRHMIFLPGCPPLFPPSKELETLSLPKPLRKQGDFTPLQGHSNDWCSVNAWIIEWTRAMDLKLSNFCFPAGARWEFQEIKDIILYIKVVN